MQKVHADQLERVSLRLGEAVLDPALWPQLMDEICRAINAKGSLLLQTDVRTPDVPFTESIKDMVESYFLRGWHKRDFRERGIPLLVKGVPVYTDQDVATPEQMRRLPYYNEFIYPSGAHWFAGVGFRSGSALWALCIQRTARQGPFQKQETSLLAGFSRHLTEVASLSKAVGRVVLSSSTNALNEVCHPAIAIDHFGLVIDVNPATEAIFDDDIRIRNRRLLIAEPRARRSYEILTQRLLVSPETEVILGIEPIVIRRQGKSPVVMRVLPVPPAARSPFLGARTILTFTALEPKPPPATELLANAFGLTPAEARLAAALANGTSVEAAAEELSISRQTARTQLKSVFLKTDTHRQSQLVALLARL